MTPVLLDHLRRRTLAGWGFPRAELERELRDIKDTEARRKRLLGLVKLWKRKITLGKMGLGEWAEKKEK